MQGFSYAVWESGRLEECFLNSPGPALKTDSSMSRKQISTRKVKIYEMIINNGFAVFV